MGRIVAWQPRQVVLTHAILAMARPSESFMLDLIPLHEITSVRAVIEHAADNDEAAESEKAKKKMKKQASLRDIHADKSSPLKAWALMQVGLTSSGLITLKTETSGLLRCSSLPSLPRNPSKNMQRRNRQQPWPSACP